MCMDLIHSPYICNSSLLNRPFENTDDGRSCTDLQTQNYYDNAHCCYSCSFFNVFVASIVTLDVVLHFHILLSWCALLISLISSLLRSFSLKRHPRCKNPEKWFVIQISRQKTYWCDVFLILKQCDSNVFFLFRRHKRMWEIMARTWPISLCGT